MGSGGFVPLLVVLLLGAVAWEVGEAGGDLTTMAQVQAAGSDLHSMVVGLFSEEEELGMDSETNRLMLQTGGGSYLSNLAVRRGAVPCGIRYRSYTSCGSPAKSTYGYSRCTGTCLRSRTVSVRPTPVASGAAAGTVPTVEGWCPKLEDERIGPPWWGHGSESGCELEDGETEEASGTDSLTNQQLLGAAGYINYRSLKEDSAQCQKRGNCRPTAVSPTPYTRCTGWCRRGDSPVDAAAYY
ncbi:unnamed protein product [Victoria cruziana]